MDFKQLQYMIAIADTRNITRAADTLFVSRSALNYSLLNLEQELGMPLFQRINNSMIPTAAGKAYLRYARQIMQLSKDCRTELSDMRDCERGCLSLGITPGYGQLLFSAVFPEFSKTYPKYDFDMVEGNVKELYSYLLDGRIDFAWSGFYRKDVGLEHIIFDRYEVLLAIPRNKCRVPVYDGSSFQPEPADLMLYRSERFVLMNKNSLVRDVADVYFQKAGFDPHVFLECSKIDMAHTIVKQGFALSFIPRNLCVENPDVVYFHIHPAEYFGLAVSFRKGAYLNKAERYFIELLKENYHMVVSPQVQP